MKPRPAALGKKAHEQTEAYREKLASADLIGQAKELAADAAERAAALAVTASPRPAIC
jgi:hypothetical protein